jgi:Mrp family chromosome partitioning ATPase
MTTAEPLLDVTTMTELGSRPAPPEGCGPLELEDEMSVLHEGIEAQLATAASRVVQFTAARRGEGTSTIVRAYAQMLARTIGRSVVIVDANDLHPDQHQHFCVTADLGWDLAVATGDSVRRAVVSTAHPNLSVAPLSDRRGVAAAVLDHARLAQMFATLRQEFQAVLVDSGPVFRGGTAALAAIADGVVLVVEAEKTRWPIASRATDAIHRGSGALLGVVLNRRRYHIPRALYPRL